MKQYKTYKDSGIEWLGKIPNSWKFSKLKYHTSKIIDGAHFTPTYIDDENGIPFLRVTDLHDSKINLENVKRIPLEEHIDLIKRCEPKKGDLLLSKNGTIGLMKIIDWDWEFSVFVSLCLIKFEKTLLNSFFYYFFMSNVVERQIFESSQKTSVTNLHLEKIKELRITIPPLEEQTQIANYLNHKTAQLDTLITKKEQLISLLHEERTAMINQAVTKGLDPNIPMKDSGIEWLGEIPEHWCNSSLKWFCEIYSGGTPSKNIDEYWINGTVPWLNSGTVNQGNIIKPSHFITNDALNNSSAKWIPEKSLVIALAGQGKTKGMVAQVMFKATCNQSMGIIVPNERIDNRFLMYWLRNNYQKIRNLGGGDKRDGLNLQMIGSIPIPIPPLNEQIKISNFINKQNDHTKSLISKIQNEINLLKEYKTALISEVVTGKVDVREEMLN